MEIFSENGVTVALDAAGASHGFQMITPVILIKTARRIDSGPLTDERVFGMVMIPKEEAGKVASEILAFILKSEKREEVKPAVGQVWIPIGDVRDQNRTLEILEIGELYASCRSKRAGSEKSRVIKIALHRFRATAGNYRLLTTLEPAKA